MKKRETKELLNWIGIPEDDKKSNGGMISDRAKYGSWLYNNNRIAFNAVHHTLNNIK